MHSYSPRVLALAMLLLCAPVAAYAQAVITGVVRDTSGGVLPGVTVEASSPALIERVRTAVTDGTGQYRIIDLRPGTYSVTFTLPGFATVVREGIELGGTQTVTVSVDMRIGGLEETITVTGQAQVVDTQSVAQQRVINREVLDAIPTGGTVHNLAALIPGAVMSAVGGSAGAQDVGGSTLAALQQVSIHGGRAGDQRVMMDGLPLNTAQGNLSGFVSNMASTQEFTIDTSGVSAEDNSGGVRMNIVPREGGNTFNGTAFLAATGSALQGTNFDDRLAARGFQRPNPPKTMERSFDVNPAFGGPIVRDRLWFYSAFTYHHDRAPVAGVFNANAGNPAEYLFVNDPSKSVYNELDLRGFNTRVTWQATPKHKLAFFYDDQYRCICPWGNPVVSPEAQQDSRYPDQHFGSITYTAPLTNRVLVDAAFLDRLEKWGFYPSDVSNFALARVNDIGLGIQYRGLGDLQRNNNSNRNYRASLSYVTGAHAMKTGFAYVRAANRPTPLINGENMIFTFNNGVPTSLQLFADPRGSDNRLDEFGLFIQDRWTVGRLTLSGGLRYDYLHTWFPAQSLGPGKFVPNRNISIEKTDWVTWHDITPRMGAAYDLFGDGRTALKVTANKYLGAQAASGQFGSGGNPLNRVANTTNRSWNDANGNFIPDCDLLNPLANGECGPYQTMAFGSVLPATNFDPDLLEGWGVRSYNWEFSTSVQQQVGARAAVEVGYFRRWYGNFVVTDNLAVSAADFDRFEVTAPADTRLPGGGGHVIGNLYNLKPEAFGRTDNLVTFADNYGGQTERWHGVDIMLSVRPSGGLFFQGGLSTGSTLLDSCALREALPETAPTNPYCRTETNFLTQFKGMAGYTIPRIDVQINGSFQSVPGPEMAANWAAPNSAVIGSLGRPLSGNAQTVQVNLIEPGKHYEERSNQVDLRVGKIFRFGSRRLSANVDMFNVLNANAILTMNNTYGPAFQRPTAILPARLIKFSAQIDF